ncbi:MAG TPA: SDR family oxidoreductase [Actinomycetales bacterium]|nr:SDR family oxidoreductase [Actinomycetales bacterium]
MELTGSVALITGASSGIGRSVALELADHGVHVLVHGRDRLRLDDVVSLTGGTPLVAELADPAQRDALVRNATEVHGRVDVLVNNAGVGWSGPVTAMTADDVDRVLEVNLSAAVHLTRLLVPGMVDRGRGAVCFVTSVAGRSPVAGEAVYSAAKAGLDAFAESLRAEARRSGVHVSVVVPGVVDTDFFANRGRPYDRALPRPVPPQAVATAVVRSIADGRPEVWVPRWLRLAPAARALAPGPYRGLSAAFGGRHRLAGDAGRRVRPGSRWP